MKDKAAHACRALCRARVAEELQRHRGTRILALSIIDRQPDRRWADAGVWRSGVIDVELSALNAAPVRRGDRRLLHRPRRPAVRRSVPQDRRPKTLLGLTSKDSVNSRRASMSRRRDGLRQHAGRPRHALSQPSTAGVSSLISGLLAP